MAGVHRSAIWYKFVAGWRLCQTEQILQDGDGASKGEASSKKADCHLDFAVEKTDIVLLVWHAWKESFAMKETHKKAIAERGWGPLNYILLDHPKLANSKQPTSIGLATAYQHLELAGSEPLDPRDPL